MLAATPPAPPQVGQVPQSLSPEPELPPPPTTQGLWVILSQWGNMPAGNAAAVLADEADKHLAQMLRDYVATGLRALAVCGYSEPHTHMVIEHALMRWARGEEEAAQRGAIDRSFHGIDLTSWLRVLASARAAAESTGSAG